MENICEKFVYICNILILVIGVVTACGGIYLIVGIDKMDEKFNPKFEKAKTNIRTMIKVINKYPGVEMINPPNVTMSEPLKDMNYEGFYVVSLSVLMLVQITAVVLFAGDRTIGCIEVLWEKMDDYQVIFVALVAIVCIIQLFQIIAICYNNNAKSNISTSNKTDQSDSRNNNSIAPFKHSLKVRKKEHSKEKLWYPEVQKNNYISTQREAWNTLDQDESLKREDKWHDGDRRKPMRKPTKSLVMDF
ncbi:uncharacterized protein LOC134699054 [Mytilus trossulus]|uniref:uncharacterized protein LOC134699054 n=1 Tax=Mytilus trossulus TaxID=6551 RepID=UPI0030076755